MYAINQEDMKAAKNKIVLKKSYQDDILLKKHIFYTTAKDCNIGN